MKSEREKVPNMAGNMRQKLPCCRPLQKGDFFKKNKLKFLKIVGNFRV